MTIAPQTQSKTAAEVRNCSVSFVNVLDSGELLTGTPTVSIAGASPPTASDEAVNAVALTILGKAVAVGQAVQFKLIEGAAGTTYTITVTATSDSTPAQTLVATLTLTVT